MDFLSVIETVKFSMTTTFQFIVWCTRVVQVWKHQWSKLSFSVKPTNSEPCFANFSVFKTSNDCVYQGGLLVDRCRKDVLIAERSSTCLALCCLTYRSIRLLSHVRWIVYGSASRRAASRGASASRVLLSTRQWRRWAVRRCSCKAQDRTVADQVWVMLVMRAALEQTLCAFRLHASLSESCCSFVHSTPVFTRCKPSFAHIKDQYWTVWD